MELDVLLFFIGITLFCDVIGIKYKGITYFLIGGVLSMYGLAELVADQLLEIWHFTDNSGDPFVYSIGMNSPAVDPGDFLVVVAAVAVFVIAHFLFVVERQTSRDI